MQKGIDFTGVCVVFFCHDGQGKFIMAKRSQNSRDERGCWDIGGGGLEFGVSVLDCISKEVKEEYNAEIKNVEFLGYRDVHRENDGKKTHWIALDYKVMVNPEGVRINEPHKFDDLGWFRLSNLPKPLHSQLLLFLKLYGERLN